MLFVCLYCQMVWTLHFTHAFTCHFVCLGLVAAGQRLQGLNVVRNQPLPIRRHCVLKKNKQRGDFQKKTYRLYHRF